MSTASWSFHSQERKLRLMLTPGGAAHKVYYHYVVIIKASTVITRKLQGRQEIAMKAKYVKRLGDIFALILLAGAPAVMSADGRIPGGQRLMVPPQQRTVPEVPFARLKGVVVPQGLMRMRPAVRPKLEVWNGQGGEFNFYGSDAFIDWNRPDLKWWFRWSDAGTGTRAVWQVCRFEPSATIANWKEPTGLAAGGELSEVPAPGKSASFSIDFRAFAPKPPETAVRSTPAPATNGRMLSAGRFQPQVHPPVPAASARAGRRGPEAAAREVIATTVQIDRPAYVGLRLAGNPWTFYVRVVVLNAKGEATGAVSTTATVRYGQPPPSDLKLPPPGPPPQPPPDPLRPRVTILEYEPIRPQASDAAEWFIVTRDFGPWKKGQVLHLTPKEPDVWDRIGNAVGGVVGFFEDAVNWVATAYQDIKKTAIDVVASSIPGCSGPCRDVLSYGLDTGLAACGMPPDLPNFDQLVDMGKGNLAATLVAQAGLSNVPFSEDLAKKMMDKVADEATRAANSGPGGNQFLRPLPDKQYRPAFVRVRITNPANAGARDAGLDFLSWYLYAERYVPVPDLKPGETREAVVFLKPDYSYWERTYLQEHGGMAGSETDMDAGWTNLYYEGQADMLASVTSWPKGSGNVLSGRPVVAGSQSSDYIKQRPVQAFHGH
jgi:hypothetical protein